MGILLIDTSAKISSFGFEENGKLIFDERTESGVNADKITYCIKSSFEKHGIKFSDIEYVSLSNGPGSFTGLRIGSAVAKGICYATGSRLIEIISLDIIANMCDASGKITSLIFSNMKNSEFYYCSYFRQNEDLKPVSDYRKGTPEEIFRDNEGIFVINADENYSANNEFTKKITDVSEFSSVRSQLQLTCKKINEKKFSDYKKSQPFYMNEFIPKI
ncbi:MAG: tRNA (adenosine(37)-N6)-threonylcarbamoyltransferase complex dimerization subunit type 1 TsaB [Bacteroidetes bacterium]|nr:tRNA (adenosine(37)-N6)-threonylcarbamoyltransferase complex dimerization subunit type 1 TsaB [Bacteroidota bacterium]